MPSPTEELTLEFTVEPFVPAKPGPHVLAAQKAATKATTAEHEIEIGPFGSAVSGTHQEIVQAVADVVSEAFANGAVRVSLQVSLPA